MRAVLALALLASSILQACQGNVFELDIGDCFDAPPVDSSGEPIDDVTIVPCSETHQNEVFARFDLPDGDWPGADQVATAAADGCSLRLAAYLGGNRADHPEIEIGLLQPTADSWNTVNDRDVVCFFFSQTTG